MSKTSPEKIRERCIARMNKVDEFDPPTRTLIHEYGFRIVDSFARIGVTEPRHIRHLIETVLDELSPVRGSKSSQGPINPMLRQ